MIGNQAIVNSIIAGHKDCMLPDRLGKNSKLNVLHIISEEYWKEWRRLMRYGNTPTVYCYKLGEFNIRYNQLRSYLYNLIKSLRFKREFHKEEILDVNNKFCEIHKREMIRFKAAWEQADTYKKWMNAKNAKWRQKKIDKYGDKAIL